MMQYIDTLNGLARQMVEDGEAEEMIAKMTIPAPFDDWLLAGFFPYNMHLLYQRRLSEKEKMAV